ncbi:hypothetical protein [Shewanella mangrovisoli]
MFLPCFGGAFLAATFNLNFLRSVLTVENVSPEKAYASICFLGV